MFPRTEIVVQTEPSTPTSSPTSEPTKTPNLTPSLTQTAIPLPWETFRRSTRVICPRCSIWIYCWKTPIFPIKCVQPAVDSHHYFYAERATSYANADGKRAKNWKRRSRQPDRSPFEGSDQFKRRASDRYQQYQSARFWIDRRQGDPRAGDPLKSEIHLATSADGLYWTANPTVIGHGGTTCAIETSDGTLYIFFGTEFPLLKRGRTPLSVITTILMLFARINILWNEEISRFFSVNFFHNQNTEYGPACFLAGNLL